MQERLIYLGKIKCKEIDNNFDDVLSKYERKAIDRGYFNKKIKFIKEKSIVKIYTIIYIDSEILPES
jgi:hypothetical protein